MNELEKHLHNIDPNLYSKFKETKEEVELLLGKYSDNFRTYTDHSIKHTMEVFRIASELLSEEEMNLLNADETYILSMACLLHDIGMCIPPERIKDIAESKELIAYRESHPNLTLEDFMRNIHHQLSNKFIVHEWELLKIASPKYAKAIGLVAEGHRKVDLGNFDIYEPQFFAKSGKDSVCLPYISAILRIADELDVTNSRIPRILSKYYMPNNEISIKEWLKHIATSQRNYLANKVIFEVSCTDQNIYAALQEQFEKIQNVINYCQKVIRSIPFIKGKLYSLSLSIVDVKYNFEGFDPKGIKFSFDVENVVNAFIGEDLYNNKFTSVREALQNSIDSCMYKSKVLKENYIPKIKILLTDSILKVEDNGAGMDEFIIENFFGRLASSFYEQDKVKNQFEAIGQFGVGVFSYFLLSEYIDIETKTKSSLPLKFRFDKDPKSYFHFYDCAERTESGTTITMHLKESVKSKITLSILEKYIRKIFRHIEIPIELQNEQSITIIENLSFDVDTKKELSHRLKLQNRKIGSSLKTVDVSINNQEIQGKCSLIIGKNYLDTFQTSVAVLDREAFLSINGHRGYSQIAISQKGVFVNNYCSPFLSFVFGDVNLKKKIKINIDRNEFSNEKEVYNLTLSFEIQFLKKIFKSLESKYKNELEKIKITNTFLNNYCNFIYNKEIFTSEYIEVLKEFLYVELLENDKISVISLLNLNKNYDEFYIINSLEKTEILAKELKKPIIISKISFYAGYDRIEEIINKVLAYNQSVIYSKNLGYNFFEKNNKYENITLDIEKLRGIWGRYSMEIVPSNSKKLLVNSWANKKEYEDQYLRDSYNLNYNHNFTKFVCSHYKEISSNTTLLKIAKAAIDFIFDCYQEEEEINKENLKKINDILRPLNTLSKLDKFTLSDF